VREIMRISVLDGSNYLKGLLLLIRKDRKITDGERELMTRVGKSLGFEKKFIENAIHEILDNKYISPVPPEFSTREITEKFIKDGLAIAFSDMELHPNEEKWLFSVAEHNGIEESWVLMEKEQILRAEDKSLHLQADDLKIAYC